MTEIKNLDILLDAIGVAKWVPKKILGLPGEGWFLLEIDPTPPDDQIIAVTNDILRNEYVAVEKGKVYHSGKCKARAHNLTSQWKTAIKTMQRQTYKVAIYPGQEGIHGGQPLAIVLDPPINYSIYPDLKHLNIGGTKDNLTIPDTLCYTDDPKGLGEELDERIFNTYRFVTIWLYRFQLWLACRELPVEEKWIGPQVVNLPGREYINAIDPSGRCRCGSHNPYIDCHMPEDFAILHNTTLDNAKYYLAKNKKQLSISFAGAIAASKIKALNLLRENLL